MFASMRNHAHCVNELIIHGADITRKQHLDKLDKFIDFIILYTTCIEYF